MKRFSFLLILLGCCVGCKVVTPPPPPPPPPISGIVVPWQLPPGCTSTTPCNFWVYRIGGVCPLGLSGSPGWTLLTTTPITQVTSYTDTSVVSGTQYSYDVESGAGSIPTSGPSSCSTFIAP